MLRIFLISEQFIYLSVRSIYKYTCKLVFVFDARISFTSFSHFLCAFFFVSFSRRIQLHSNSYGVHGDVWKLFAFNA